MPLLIALVENENGQHVEKERYDFEDQRRMQPQRWLAFGAVIGLLGGPIGALFGYGIGSPTVCFVGKGR